MVDKLIQQVKSKDAAQRKQAIIGLANSGHPRSVDVLHQISTSDPDPALRDYAAKAEAHARKKVAQIEALSADPFVSSGAVLAESAPNYAALSSDPTPASSTARGQLNNAYGAKVNGDN